MARGAKSYAHGKWATRTAGGWDAQAIDTINRCASRIDLSRRGHVVGIWWQMLSVALQREHERVLRWKVGACSGLPPPSEHLHEDVFSLDALPGGIF